MDRKGNKRQRTREKGSEYYSKRKGWADWTAHVFLFLNNLQHLTASSSRRISKTDPAFADLVRTTTSGSASTHSSSGSSTVVPHGGSSPVLSRNDEGDSDSTMVDDASTSPSSPILSEKAKGKKRLTSDPHGPSPVPTMSFAIPLSRIDIAAWQNMFSAAPPLIGPNADHVEMSIAIEAPEAIEGESPGDYVERLEEVLELQEDYASLLKGGRGRGGGEEEVPEAFWDAVEAGRGNLEGKIAWVRVTFGEIDDM